jgi:hypothetical protein
MKRLSSLRAFSPLCAYILIIQSVVQNNPKPNWLPIWPCGIMAKIANKGSFDNHFKPTFRLLLHLEKDVIFHG